MDMNRKKNKLAIFDLDGTLFDTCSVNFFAYQRALREEGYILDRNYYKTQCNGRYFRDFLPLIIDNPTDDLIERIHHRKKQLYPTFLHHAVINSHLFCLIEQIHDEYHIALVTTASKANCIEILDHNNKTSLFELILTQEDVFSVKPDPEGFLKAMAHFGIAPKFTLVFEDSSVGIEAARRCGTSILAVLNFPV